ncbi:MAG: MFS transporter, partial [Deltaproteobacteria bacterium]|nr:MFS transporter [Deltaproteobacteria bacterium]
MVTPGPAHRARTPGRFYYGWYIVAVGFIANVGSSFALASTLSIFLKPMTLDLGVSRGVFSMLRSGEGLIAASMAPMVGSLVDRHGSRWLLTAGAMVAAVGYLLLSQVEVFWQFVAVRWTLVTVGDGLIGYMVVNVMIARWFVVKRGRAMAFASMGIGFAKVVMPFLVAPLLVWLGWRHTWAVFALFTVALVVAPALIYVRRSPEDMGLHPDGLEPGAMPEGRTRRPGAQAASETRTWSRSAGMRTQAFWLIVAVFGVSSVGVTGLNLHVFPYIT